VARRIGEKDREGAATAAGQAIVCGAAVGIATGLAGVFLAARLLGLMGAPASVIHAGSGYARIVLGGNVAIVLLFLINGVFRGSGDAAAAMRTLWLANLINMTLDPCFIYGFAFFPRLGVTGAAVATTIGRSIGVVYQLAVLFRGKSRVRLALRHVRPDWPVMGRLLRVGSTAMLQYFISTASWVSLARINALFGSAAIAGYTLALRIILFALMPSWGIASAAATLVGQGLGAGDPGFARRAGWHTTYMAIAMMSGLGLVIFVLAPEIARLFIDDPAVIALTITFMYALGAAQPLMAVDWTLTGALRGAGDTQFPLFASVAGFYGLRLALTILILHYHGSVTLVWWSLIADYVLRSGLKSARFRSGRWENVQV